MHELLPLFLLSVGKYYYVSYPGRLRPVDLFCEWYEFKQQDCIFKPRLCNQSLCTLWAWFPCFWCIKPYTTTSPDGWAGMKFESKNSLQSAEPWNLSPMSSVLQAERNLLASDTTVSWTCSIQAFLLSTGQQNQRDTMFLLCRHNGRICHHCLRMLSFCLWDLPLPCQRTECCLGRWRIFPSHACFQFPWEEGFLCLPYLCFLYDLLIPIASGSTHRVFARKFLESERNIRRIRQNLCRTLTSDRDLTCTPYSWQQNLPDLPVTWWWWLSTSAYLPLVCKH